MHTRRNAAKADGLARRRLLVGAGGLAWLGLSGCAALRAEPPPWEARLRGPAVVLLGETHDNAQLHRLRLATLRRALATGWRPALAMEQFDTDRQADIDRARRDKPHDARYLIAQAAPPLAGWDWELYRPVIELALAHDLTLVAANLSRKQAGRLVRADYAAVLGAERAHELGLDRALPPDLLSAQQHEVDAGHCGALPAPMLPGMARAQIARDAVMAERLRHQAGRGIVLLAGNGHVRRDLGVPRWLTGIAPQRVLTVGYLEEDDTPGSAPRPAERFDAVVLAPRVPRADPCESFRKQASGSA